MRKKPYKNPKFNEIYMEGFTHGKELSKNHIAKAMIEQIERLHEVEGIGKVTIDKFKRHFCQMGEKDE